MSVELLRKTRRLAEEALLLARRALGGSGAPAIIPTIQAVADPIYLSSFAKPTDVFGGLWDIDLAIGRFNAAAPFATNGFISWLKIDTIARAQAVLNTSIVGLAFNQADPQVTTVPSECALRITGPGSAGIIQCKGSNPSAITWDIACGGPNNHGLADVEDIWAMGDPTLGAGVADSNCFMSINTTYELFARRFRIYGFLGASNVLQFVAATVGDVWGIHTSGCGTLASGVTPATVYVRGFEQAWHAYGWVNGSVQPPANVPAPASKNVATTPYILRDTSVGTANFSGVGDHWEEITASDTTSSALTVNSNASIGTGVGPQYVTNFYAESNCANGAGLGCLSFQGVQGGVHIFGGRVRLNGATTTPAVAILGGVDSVKIERQRVDFGFGYFFNTSAGSNGTFEMDECLSDTPGQRVPVLSSATVNGVPATAAVYPTFAGGGVAIKEKYGGITSDYQTDSGAGVSANQTASVISTGPTVGTAPTTASAQDIIGVFATTVAAASLALDIVQRRGQPGIVVINDGAGAIPSPDKITPSAATAGRVKLAGSAAVSIGVVETSIAAPAGSTGAVRLI
jgi:hypothetical protein